MLDLAKQQYDQEGVTSGNAPIGGAVILLYHRVAELETDPLLLSISRKHFAEHLDVLRRYTRPMSLAALRDAAREKEIPPCAVAVTFDDGYADNLYHAKPLLEAADVPAHVFVVAGSLRTEREFWWDELEHILLHTSKLPQKLSIDMQGQWLHGDLGRSAQWTSADIQHHRDWSVVLRNDPTRRHTLYRQLLDLLRPMAAELREDCLDSIARWAGHCRGVRDTHRTLNEAELRELVEGDCIDVGAHTVTHPLLAALTPSAQDVEIRESKRMLEDIIERPVSAFSYPYGTRRDYSSETVRSVREAGYDCACANYAGSLHGDTDILQLPRMIVRNGDGETLLRCLREVGVAG